MVNTPFILKLTCKVSLWFMSSLCQVPKASQLFGYAIISFPLRSFIPNFGIKTHDAPLPLQLGIPGHALCI